MLATTEPRRAELPVPTLETEAARYALLRRLAPSIRHHLVVHLQPIGMIREVMERRLHASEPDPAQVGECANKISSLAKAALASAVDVAGWLAPDEAATTTVQEGVRECAGLLATSLSFRGYALRTEVQAMPGQVRRSAMRTLLAAGLLHATDFFRSPAELVVSAQAGDEGATLQLQLRPTPGEQGFTTEAAYRKLQWSDLQALGAGEGVAVSREGDTLRLVFPWAGDG